MNSLEFYQKRVCPGDVVDWNRWQLDMKKRLRTQEPLRYIPELPSGLLFELLLSAPEPSYQEVVTTSFIADYLLSRGLRLSNWTGKREHETHLVFGEGDEFDIAFRCDLDALSMTGCERNHVHACGHATNMATLLTLASRSDLRRPGIALIFQPAEEGPGREEDGYVHPNGYGGGQYLRRLGIYQHVRTLISCHLDTDLAPNEVRLTAGLATAGALRFVYESTGQQCHAALPQNGANPVDALHLFLNRTEELRREFAALPSDAYGLLTVTRLETSAGDLNTLPLTVTAKGILRIVGEMAMSRLRKALPPSEELMIERYGRSHKVIVKCSLETEAPPVENDPELVAIASRVAQSAGFTIVPQPARFRDETAWAGTLREPWVEVPSDWPGGCERTLHFFVSAGNNAGALHKRGFYPDPDAVIWEATLLQGILEELRPEIDVPSIAVASRRRVRKGETQPQASVM